MSARISASLSPRQPPVSAIILSIREKNSNATARRTSTLCPTVTPVVGPGDAIDYVCAHRSQPRGNMKDQRKKVVENTEETQVLEQRPDVAGEDDTQRMRTLTFQQLERLLKDEKPG